MFAKRYLVIAGACAAFLLPIVANAEGKPPQRGEKDRAASQEGPGTSRKIEWLSIRGDFGYTGADLTTFQASGKNLTADFIPSRLSGPSASLFAGVRLWFVTLGARGSMAFFSDDSPDRTVHGLNLWSLDGEAMFHLLSGYKLEPYLVFGAGYSALGGVADAAPGVDYRVRGFNTRAGVGLDWFVSRHVSIGALATGEWLLLARPGVSATGLVQPKEVNTIGEARARALEADGASSGLAFSLVIGPGLHF